MRLNQLVSADSAHGRTRSEAKVTKTNKPSKIAVFCLSGDSHNKLLFVFQKFLQHRALFTTIFNCVFEVSKVWLIFFSSALLKINGCSRKNKNSVNFQIPVLLMWPAQSMELTVWKFADLATKTSVVCCKELINTPKECTESGITLKQSLIFSRHLFVENEFSCFFVTCARP